MIWWYVFGGLSFGEESKNRHINRQGGQYGSCEFTFGVRKFIDDRRVASIQTLLPSYLHNRFIHVIMSGCKPVLYWFTASRIVWRTMCLSYEVVRQFRSLIIAYRKFLRMHPRFAAAIWCDPCRADGISENIRYFIITYNSLIRVHRAGCKNAPKSTITAQLLCGFRIWTVLLYN